MTTFARLPIFLFCLLVFLQLSGIAQTNEKEYKSFNQSIEKGKANEVKALINVNGGELVIHGESNNLSDVNFNYFDDYWNPSVSYTESDETGKLIVKSNANFVETKIKDKNNCTIALNKKVSYALGIEMGAGIADINLNNYSISRALFRLGVGSFEIDLTNTNVPLLKVEAGVGEAVINVSGERNQNLSAEISAGIGELTLIVPENIGVILKISGFLGEINAEYFKKEGKTYTNKAYSNSKVLMEFDITGAIGSIKVLQR